MNSPSNDRPANHARDRIYGGGEPMELAFAPGPADWRRWLLVGAEGARVDDLPQPEE